ncbi:MAG: sigma-70 family RNA polymerase sigma factor [Planctomycetota bacterium]|nr:sigma-70 family RNA polymerase sigma factor [Planctomycetota bacterium]
MTGLPEHNSSGGSTSRSLLNEARLADAAAWERLVRLYTPLVASWCRRWRVSEQDIVDVLQEVFSAVASHLGRFRKDRPDDTFRGWLMVIARSKIMDYFNSRNRELAGAGGTEATRRLQDIRDAGANSVSDVEASDADENVVFSEVLRRALESIKEEFHDRTWQAFWKVVVEGRLSCDVAADLDMKPGTVRVSKSRVLLRLRHELGDLGQ